MDVAELIALLTTITALTTSLGFLITALRIKPKVDDVHKEVKTINGQTIAEIIEGVENRRLTAQKKLSERQEEP